MTDRRDVSFPCGNIILEGVLEIPDGHEGPLPGAVICHPHPLYGGNMYNNVTSALKKGLVARGVVALRFNFRGTGRSEGSYGKGIDERQDVQAALDYLGELDQVDPERLVLAGYSFGCWVALKAAQHDPRPKRLIGISPPLDAYDFDFLIAEARPKLLLAGDRDFVCPASKFEQLLQEIPEPKAGKILHGADHFHQGREDDLVEEMGLFLEAFPLGSQ